MSAVRMALRDASWISHQPNVRSPKVYHVIVSPPYAPACYPSGVVLDENSEQPVEAVAVGMRCQRPACRNRWSGESSPNTGPST